MTTTTCSTCNGELLTSNGQTFCPACLLQQGMKSSTYGAGPRIAWKPPELEQLSIAFPHLEILQLLGQGGMGAVYKVRQKELDRIAALKVLPGEMAADAGFTERFLREARLLASLSHPHIVTVYEFGQREGIYFLLMEFIDGVTLRQALRAEPIKKLASKETLAIVGQLCDALQFAHDEGVVHRDIKPENILIDKRGRVKIADFGLARLLGQSPTMPTLTGTHQLMGTPAYMAPEQIEGLPGIDHRADIYSMGVVFYELLTGELPLGRFSPPSERAETDVRLDEVVLRTLAREPDRRYQQASQVKVDVEALRSPAVALNPLAMPAPRRWIGKGVVGFEAGVLATPFIAVLIYFMMEFQNRRILHTVTTKAAEAANLEGMAKLQAVRDQELRQQQKGSWSPVDLDGAPGMMKAGGSEAGDMDKMLPGILEGSSPPAMSGEEMGGGMGMGMSAGYSGPAIVFNSDGPALHEQSFPALTAEQHAAVNAILKETHERYLKEEALQSLVSVDAGGMQTTEISAFPDQLRAIENEMWTMLDDAVPVETQKEFRDRLNLYTTDQHSDGTSAMGMGGSGGGYTGGSSGIPGGMMSSSTGTGPGLLGWKQGYLPMSVKVSRNGRWFEWSVRGSTYGQTLRKNPTLPFALQRFYREPGPWMAVANARATYAAKNWMKLADYFTAEAMTREYLNANALGEVLEARFNDAGTASAGLANNYSQRMLEEVARSPELAEMLGKAIVGQAQELEDPEINFEKLIVELHAVQLGDVDTTIERAAKAMPQETLRNGFAMWALTTTIMTDEEFELEFLDGEVSSYTETGGTASATLTIPNKPPVPIRFKRENGQWKIDAIGSNERLLERLKQTKIWKQHTEIEAVLENARTAYAAKEWRTLADCFTRAGKYRWTLRTDAMERPDVSTLSAEEGNLQMEKALAETGRWFVQQAAAGEADGKPLPSDTQNKESGLLFEQFLVCPANESDALLIKLTERLPEALIDTIFASAAIQSIVEPPENYRFDFDGCQINDLKSAGEIATASLSRMEGNSPVKGTSPVPVRFVKQDGQWKVDAIGTPEELQQQTRIYRERKNGASPRAAVEAFREAMADGRFQTALNCMTEDARNEWLGEILISFTHSMGLRPLASRFPTDEPLFGLNADHPFLQSPTETTIKLQNEDDVYGSIAIDSKMRRKACIDLSLTVPDIDKLLQEFMNVRSTQHPASLPEYKLGKFEEVPDRSGPKGAMRYVLQPASPDQPPLELDIIQIDGLWKLNTIIDPAMKPWPLPAEETAPPAEPIPVDGATGLQEAGPEARDK